MWARPHTRTRVSVSRDAARARARLGPLHAGPLAGHGLRKCAGGGAAPTGRLFTFAQRRGSVGLRTYLALWALISHFSHSSEKRHKISRPNDALPVSVWLCLALMTCSRDSTKVGKLINHM